MNLDDLAGPTCPQCGADIPEHKRADTVYCSRRCVQRAYDALVSQARRDAKANRPPCKLCGTPLAHERIATAIYCSRACSMVAHNAIARYPGTCQHCGCDFMANQKYQRFCSLPCRDIAVLRKHHPRACTNCGSPYQPKNDRSKYCSRRCSALHRETTRPRKGRPE